MNRKTGETMVGVAVPQDPRVSTSERSDERRADTWLLSVVLRRTASCREPCLASVWAAGRPLLVGVFRDPLRKQSTVSVAGELSGPHLGVLLRPRLHRPTRAVSGVALHNIDLLCRGLFASTEQALPAAAGVEGRDTWPGGGRDGLMWEKTWSSINC